ncbi:MAG: hypothetical protein EA416_06405 [Trueperaceae bacterium]|nr:MAG: hypothetical protein EA416_06405 [Trueperaceae bacterium]
MNPRALGILLVLGGLVILLGGRGAFGLFGELVWLAALGALAAIVWRALSAPRVLPLRLAVHAGFAITAAATTTQLSGPAFLGFVAWAFWLVYLTPSKGRARIGWALIPAGVVSTLAAVAAVDTLWPRWDGGSVFLLGMTATFTAIYLLPRERGGGRWALWPALVWAAITVLANDPTGAFTRWILPLTLIGIGVALLGWTRRRR